MLHDETVYPDPMVFDPSRFANPTRDDGSKINPEPIQAFGFSRRICPGRFLALDVIWLTVASVLATFDISEPADSNASTIRLKPDYTSSLIRWNPHFFMKCFNSLDTAIRNHSIVT